MQHKFSSSKSSFHTPVILFLGALALRLSLIIQTNNLPLFHTFIPFLDESLHWQAGRVLRLVFAGQGFGLGSPMELQLPSSAVFPLLIAVTQSAVGENILAHRVFMAILGSLTVSMVFLCAESLFRKRLASFFAGALFALLPSITYFNTSLEKVSAELFLCSLALLLLIRSRDTKNLQYLCWQALAFGLLVSLLILDQFGFFLLPLIFALSILFDARRIRAGKIFQLIGVLLIPFFVVGAFHYRHILYPAANEFFLPQGGIHTRIGFNPDADGAYSSLEGIIGNPLGHVYFSRMVKEVSLGRELSATESDKLYFQDSFQFIYGHKAEALKLIGKKFAIFFNNYEPKGNTYLPDLKERCALLKSLPVNFGIVFVLAVVGIYSLFRKQCYWEVFLLLGVIVAVLLWNLATFVTWRYRIGEIIPLVLLAGAGVAGILETLQGPSRGKYRQLAVMLLLAGITAWFTYRPTSLDEEAEMEKAQVNFNEALSAAQAEEKIDHAANLSSLNVNDNLERARLLVKLNRFSEAILLFSGLAKAEVNCLDCQKEFVFFLVLQGRYQEAREYLNQLEAIAPITFLSLKTDEEFTFPVSNVLNRFIFSDSGRLNTSMPVS